MDSFIPAYFMALSGSLREYVPSEKMLKALMGGTRLMMTKDHPLRTLKSVFDDYFYPEIGVERETLQLQIEKFYDQVFPDLSHLTSPIPEAITLVETAFNKGYDVVIATNPLFPLKAINHRLRWAGLPPEDYPYKIVTSYEKFHFTKENNAYFPEILGKLGWPESPVVMVGNDLTMDIQPARSAGLPVYWVNGEKPVPQNDEDILHGSLMELRSKFDEPGSFSILHLTETPSSIVACMRVIPALIEDHLALFSNQENVKERSVGIVSLKEMLIELINFDSGIYSAQIEACKSYLPDFSSNVDFTITNMFAENSSDLNELLESFAKNRMKNLGMIENVISHPMDPSRGNGSSYDQVVENARRLVEHDKAVIKQLCLQADPLN